MNSRTDLGFSLYHYCPCLYLYDGRAIFEELNENPSKALKHPPKDADDFGKKYAQGFYALEK